MPQPSPTRKTLADLKATILRPATTANFQCWFNPPEAMRTWARTHRIAEGFGDGYDSPQSAEFFSLSCAEATLPGSSLATHEINNDFTGVTERHAYRRQFDDRSNFTFYPVEIMRDLIDRVQPKLVCYLLDHIEYRMFLHQVS